MIFKRKKNTKQPERTAALRHMLEKAYSRRFSDSEIHDLAVTVNQFLPLVTDPDRALQTSPTPLQLLFACAALKSEHGAAVLAAVQGIAATAAERKV
jgi:hypothetical protein